MLPLGVRNRLAELVLAAFDDLDSRRTLDALAEFCRTPDGRVGPAAVGRLASLGWFTAAERDRAAVTGAHCAHLPELCRRAARAAAMFAPGTPVPDARVVEGLLGRAALLADTGLFFEVHELLEPAWLRAEGAPRLALQGLIQIAVGQHHLANGNQPGAVSLLSEGLAKLAGARGALPLDTTAWEANLAALLVAVRDGVVSLPSPAWPRPAEAAWRSS